jgi:AraC-like DNA-binding protein
MRAGHPHRSFVHPALPGLSALAASFSRHSFPLHIHDTATMGVIVAGVNRFWNRGAEHYATRHTICVVNADEPHTGGTCTADGFTYFNLYVPDSLFVASWQDLNGQAHAPRFGAQVIADDDAVRAFMSFAEGLSSLASPLLVEELWLALCAVLFERHVEARRPAAALRTPPRQIRIVRDFLDESPTSNVTLAQLSEVSGLSRFQIVRGFTKHTGLPPHTYHLQKRIERARTMILDGTDLPEVAAHTGFTDQAHLTRHFRRHFGVTPGLLRPPARAPLPHTARKNVQDRHR